MRQIFSPYLYGRKIFQKVLTKCKESDIIRITSANGLFCAPFLRRYGSTTIRMREVHGQARLRRQLSNKLKQEVPNKMANDARVKITLACTECKQRNYDTKKNKKNDPDRLELKKYCKFCRKHTLHKETK